MDEQFKELPEFPGYQIGNMGTVIGKNGEPMKPFISGNNKNKKGYYCYGLYINGATTTRGRGRLMCIAFIPNPENKREVDHINQDSFDDRLENLRWATKPENNQNRGKFRNNTSGIKGLCYNRRYNLWQVELTRNGIKMSKCFKERQDAIEFLEEII